MALELDQTEDTKLIGFFNVRTNAADVAEFATALGLKLAPGSVPLTFPICWLALPAVREAMEKAIGTPHPVHASQSFQFGSSIETDRDYSFQVAIGQYCIPSPRCIVRGTVCDHDNRVVLQLETVLYPTTIISTAMMSTQYPAKSSSLPEIEIGPIDVRKIERYTAAAHDYNPLHCDPDFARSVGLDGPIIPGMMMMGALQEALSEWRMTARVSRLFILFVRPVPIGSCLVIGGRIVSHPSLRAEDQQIVRLFVRTERHQVACIGEASIDLNRSSNTPIV